MAARKLTLALSPLSLHFIIATRTKLVRFRHQPNRYRAKTSLLSTRNSRHNELVSSGLTVDRLVSRSMFFAVYNLFLKVWQLAKVFRSPPSLNAFLKTKSYTRSSILISLRSKSKSSVALRRHLTHIPIG